ncbi:MAG: T9SS type A sorting domain-containing protein, partial [Bacteroidota bacterium]
GIGKLRVKVMKTEFNMNWYNITEKAQGITENQGHEMKIFPNPSRDHFTLEIPDMKGQKKFLVLRGLNGIVIKEMELPDNTESQNISVRDIPEGFYFLEVEVSGKILRTKLIIQ